VFADPDIAEAIISETDCEAERNRAQKCVESKLISFEVRSPVVADVVEGIKSGHLPLVSLDYGLIHQTGMYEGHMVVASGVSDLGVELYDPGPPGESALVVSLEKLDAAIHSPMPDGGAVALLSRVAPDGET